MKAREIVVFGLLGVERKRLRRARQGQSFHRRGKHTIGQRAVKKLNGKTSWYKTKPKDVEEEKEKRKENLERSSQKEEVTEGWKCHHEPDPKSSDICAIHT